MFNSNQPQQNQGAQQPGQAATPPVPGNGTEQVEGSTPQGASQFVTKEEATRLANEAAAKAFQTMQSMQAKQTNALKEEVNRRLAVLEKAGIQLTPEQASVLQQETMSQMQTANVQPPQEEQQSEQTFNDPVNAMAFQMQKDAGVFIERNDPEWNEINMTSENPWDFIKTLQSAIEKKRQRTTKEPSPAGVPTLAAGTHTDLMKQYQVELAQHRGDPSSITTIQHKYRAMGLKI